MAEIIFHQKHMIVGWKKCIGNYGKEYQLMRNKTLQNVQPAKAQTSKNQQPQKQPTWRYLDFLGISERNSFSVMTVGMNGRRYEKYKGFNL